MLAAFDIKRQLELDFQQLIHTKNTFNELKGILTSKLDIGFIVDNLCRQFQVLKNNDEVKMIQDLEKNACIAQQQSDELTRQELLSRFFVHIDQLRTQEQLLTQVQSTKYALEIQQSFLTPPYSFPVIEVSNPQGLVHSHASTTVHINDPIPTQLSTIRLQLDAAIADETRINNTIASIKQAQANDTAIMDAISRRSLALSDFISSKSTNVYTGLSAQSVADLQKVIAKAKRTQDELYKTKLNELYQLAYPTFLEQFNIYINNTKDRPDNEIGALRHILYLMKTRETQHLETIRMESELSRLNRSCEQSRLNLAEKQNKIPKLERSSSSLRDANTQLTQDNIARNQSMDENNQAAEDYGYPALILLIPTVITGVPLLLALNSVLIIAEVPLIVLSVTAAIFGLLTVLAGIPALYCSLMAYFDKSTIEQNLQTIEDNKLKIRNESSEINTIKEVDIPGLEQAIRETTNAITAKKLELDRSKQMEDDLVSKAVNTEPFSVKDNRYLMMQQNIDPNAPAPSAPVWDDVKDLEYR